MRTEEWKVHGWMKPYVPFISAARNEEELLDLMNDHDTAVQINAPRAMLCVSAKSQVSLLERLHYRGALVDLSSSSGKNRAKKR